jgi:hypothetical protein
VTLHYPCKVLTPQISTTQDYSNRKKEKEGKKERKKQRLASMMCDIMDGLTLEGTIKWPSVTSHVVT